jgi:hypothetical protein
MMAAVLPLVLALVAALARQSSAAAPALHAYSWQLNSSYLTTDYDTGLLVQTLQGLANRAAGEGIGRPLLVDSFELFSQYNPADRYWASYLTTEKGMNFTNLTAIGEGSLDGLLRAAALPGVINGSVLIDGSAPEPDGTRYAALTLCGLEGLLPVTPALRDAHPMLAALPVAHDLRKRFATNKAAYEWALSELMPRVDQSVGWSAGRSHTLDDGHFVWQGSPPEMPLLGLDVAIAKRGFMFNLSPNATQCEAHPARWFVDCRGSPQEAALFDRVMEGLNGSSSSSGGGGGGGGSSSSSSSSSSAIAAAPSGAAAAVPASSRPLPAIYGWSETESEYTIRVSKGGGYVLWYANTAAAAAAAAAAAIEIPPGQ